MRAVPLPNDRFRMWDGNFRTSQSALCTYSVRGGVRCGVRCGAVVVVVGHKIPKLKVAASMARPVRFGCCEGRFQLYFYHIIIFRGVRTGVLWGATCFGGLSRWFLLEFGAHFWAVESTCGIPLALLKSKDTRFVAVVLLIDFCMRWNRQFSCVGSANGQAGVIFWWVLDSFFGRYGRPLDSPWRPIGSQRHSA